MREKEGEGVEEEKERRWESKRGTERTGRRRRRWKEEKVLRQ